MKMNKFSVIGAIVGAIAGGVSGYFFGTKYSQKFANVENIQVSPNCSALDQADLEIDLDDATDAADAIVEE